LVIHSKVYLNGYSPACETDSKERLRMDPKRLYKENDKDGFPKYFLVGTIVPIQLTS
jgi:hypothetical protein